MLPDRFYEHLARKNETVHATSRGALVDEFNLYRLLRGESSPTAGTRKKLLAYFAIEFDDLFEYVPASAEEGTP